MLWTMAVLKGREGLAKQTFGFILLLFALIGLVFLFKMIITKHNEEIKEVKMDQKEMRSDYKRANKEIKELLKSELNRSTMVIEKNNNLIEQLLIKQ